MPRLIEPPSLRKASLQSIVSNYSYWCVDQSASQSDFISPFRYLRDDEIQEIILLLSKKPGFESCDIQYLFHPNLRHLDLGGHTKITDYCIRILSDRCPKLTHLCLNCFTKVQPSTLCELVSSLPELISLQLEKTNTDRSVLQKITENCPKLLHLNVEYCLKLTNRDFLVLCTKLPGIVRRLKTLKQTAGLSVDTVVSLLNSHRDLISLGECELIDQAFGQMYGKKYQLKKEFQQSWVHNLSEVTISETEGEIVDLELTSLCCPHLTRLSLYLYGPIHGLKAVSNVKSLKSLSIEGNFHFKNVCCTFQTVAVPILEIVGEHLTSLCLCFRKQVCVFLIGKLCPNLQSLDLRLRIITYNPGTVQHFRQLKVLKIADINPKRPTIPPGALSVILENATVISQINFDFVGNLTDSIISKANTKHGFRFLTKARFYSCSHITKETGMILLSPANPLKELYFKYCDNIKNEDMYVLKTYAKHEHFNISFK